MFPFLRVGLIFLILIASQPYQPPSREQSTQRTSLSGGSIAACLQRPAPRLESLEATCMSISSHVGVTANFFQPPHTLWHCCVTHLTLWIVHALDLVAWHGVIVRTLFRHHDIFVWFVLNSWWGQSWSNLYNSYRSYASLKLLTLQSLPFIKNRGEITAIWVDRVVETPYFFCSFFGMKSHQEVLALFSCHTETKPSPRWGFTAHIREVAGTAYINVMVMWPDNDPVHVTRPCLYWLLTHPTFILFIVCCLLNIFLIITPWPIRV